MENPQIEQLLRKIEDLEAVHAQIKQEISTTLVSDGRVPDSSAAAFDKILRRGEDGEDSGACVVFDYFASWTNVATMMGKPSSSWRDFRGRGGGTRFLQPTFQLSERQYLNILQSLGQAIHVVDVDNRLIYWNRGAERLYGYTSAEALNSDVFELMVDEEYHELGIEILNRVKVGETWTGLFPLRSKRGRRCSVVITDSPLYDDDGILIGASCIGCDSTPFRNSEFTLPGTRNSETDISFGQVKRGAKARHALDPEQPRQAVVSSKIINLATKVSNRVRSKLKIGKNIVEHEAGNTHICYSDHALSDANAFLNNDSVCSFKDGSWRNAAPPSGMVSPADELGSNLRNDWVETSREKSTIHNISLKVEDWISKKTKIRHWKGNKQEFSEPGSNKFGGSWLQVDHDYVHLSPPRKSKFQGNECVCPHVVEPYESLSSSINFSSTNSISSSGSGCSSPLRQLEIATDSDYEILREDLIFKDQVGRGSCGTVYHGLWCGSVEFQKVGILHGLLSSSLESRVSSATTSLSLGTGVWSVAIQPSSDLAISGMYRVALVWVGRSGLLFSSASTDLDDCVMAVSRKHYLNLLEDVAIKVFSGVEYSKEAILSFRQEVSLLKALRHPNILLFMGVVSSPQKLCIVTEFLPRGSLFHILQKKSDELDWRRRINMALDIAQGMNYLHRFTPPIIHRDLKSSNLLVDRDWNVKVADFGLSRIKYETFLLTKSGKGTPQWMAPEVCRYEPSDEKSDIYSYGVILWEIATGKIPWEDLNSMQVIGAVGFMNQRLEIPNNVDSRWKAMIESCWQSEPRSRPSFEELIKWLKDMAQACAGRSRGGVW